jgi:hypothetical protein
MKPSTKWIIGLTLTGLAIGAGVYFYNQSNKPTEVAEKPDNLTEADWNELLAAAVAKEKLTGKSNAISTLSTKPVLAEIAKQQFLQNGNRKQFDTLMAVLKSDKNDPDSVTKSQLAIINYVSELASKKS